MGQNHNVKTGNGSLTNAVKFKYLGMTLTNQKCMHEEIKSK